VPAAQPNELPVVPVSAPLIKILRLEYLLANPSFVIFKYNGILLPCVSKAPSPSLAVAFQTFLGNS
jgi:hypothetical protein